MNRLLRRWLLWSLPAASLSVLAAAPACGSGTEGRIVTLEMALETLPEPDRAPGAFTTGTGWEVELEQAVVALGPIWAFAPEDDRPSMALRRMLLGVAHAHGGFDPLTGRRVRAEQREPVVFDALADEPRSLGPREAEAGEVETLTVVLAEAEPDTPGHDRVRGHQAWVAGEATKQGETVRFAGGIDIEDQGRERRIDNIELRALLDDGGVITVGLRPSEWLWDAHFDRLEQTDDEGRMRITPESQVRAAWLLGLRSPAAYGAQWKPAEGETE